MKFGRKIKRALIVVAGVLLILLGIVGLVFPILQGWLLIATGVVLLSYASKRVRIWMDAHTARFPILHRLTVRADTWLVRVVGRLDNER